MGKVCGLHLVRGLLTIPEPLFMMSRQYQRIESCHVRPRVPSHRKFLQAQYFDLLSAGRLIFDAALEKNPPIIDLIDLAALSGSVAGPQSG